MTGLLEKPLPEVTSGAGEWVLASDRPPVAGFLARHGLTLTTLVPVLAVAAVVNLVNIAGYPARSHAEGTPTAQAWSVLRLGQLEHYTSWFDQPPLGWLQISGYAELTGSFDRYGVGVIAAREAMTLFALVSVLLVWVLCRRLGLGRVAASVAALLLAVSPLAVALHRTVYLENVAMPWLLGAFVLATVRRHQLVAFAGSALAVSVAILSSPSFLLVLPFLGWMMWRSSQPETRRPALAVAATVAVVIGAGYALFAVLRDGVDAAPGRLNLLGGALLHLGGSASSRSIFDARNVGASSLSTWEQLDATFLVTGVLAAIAGVFLVRIRPLAALVVVVGLVALVPGIAVPPSYVILALPFLALAIAGLVDEAILWVRSRERSFWRRMGHRVTGGALLIAAIAAVAIATPHTVTQLRAAFSADADRPVRLAEQWVAANVPHDSRVIVDNVMWVDLVEDGFRRANVIWYDSIDTDPAVKAQAPNGWRDSDYVVSTTAMRAVPPAASELRGALENSERVASFGRGSEAVEVRRIEPHGLSAARFADAGLIARRAELGSELLANPHLAVSSSASEVLTDGQLDSRLLLLLGQLSASVDLSLVTAPVLPGESGELRRAAVVTTGEAAGDRELFTLLRAMTGRYAPAVVRTSTGLQLTFSAVEPDVLG